MTLRSHIYVVNFLILTSLLGLACAGRPHQAREEAGLKLTALDVAGRGKPDTWRWTKPAEGTNPEILVKEELDLNLDGKWDLRRYFDAGTLSRMEIDLDFDGKPDVVEFYEKGLLSRVESSHNFSGKVDTWKFYEKGVLTRIERDTNGDGKPDEWLYYSDGRLKRLGRDLNFDGIVDTWE